MVEAADAAVRDAGRGVPAAVRDVVRRAHLPRVRLAPGSGPLLGVSAIAGAVAGVGASAFYRLFHLLRGWFIEGATGLRVATTASEPGGAHAMTGPVRPWMVPIVVATGALVSGMVVTRWTGKPSGGGANAAIASVHDDPTGAGLWRTVVQLIGAAITIGTGGSSGSEGPAALIGAGLCSVLARWCRLTEAQARIVVTSGMAACVGAIFRAPLGGALLGPELLYRRDMATKAVIPSMVASVTAFSIFGTWNGFSPMFGENSGYRFDHPAELIAFVVLGLVAGLLGRMYVATLHATTAWFDTWRLRPMFRPCVAGLAVGVLGLAVPGVLGTGYGVVQQSLDARHLLAVPIVVLIGIPFAKILGTSLTMGSGAAGGVFGPGMVIGGTAGAALWRLLLPTGFVSSSPVPYVIVGIAACLGSIAHAPIAVLIMAVETTNNLSLLVPPMIAVAVAVVVVGDMTLYRAQRADRSADDHAAGSADGRPERELVGKYSSQRRGGPQ